MLFEQHHCLLSYYSRVLRKKNSRSKFAARICDPTGIPENNTTEFPKKKDITRSAPQGMNIIPMDKGSTDYADNE
jgi:hypothetical protein